MKKFAPIFMTAVMVTLCLALATACSTGPSLQSEKEDQRASLRDMAKSAMSQLLSAKPRARAAVSGSAGYAVFTDYGFQVIFLGDSKALGVAVRNTTKQEGFLKMIQLRPELGGPDKFRVILIFETEEALSRFMKAGWTLDDAAMATAVIGKEGSPFAGALSFPPGLHVYELDQSGAVVDVGIRNVMFYRDRELDSYSWKE